MPADDEKEGWRSSQTVRLQGAKATGFGQGRILMFRLTLLRPMDAGRVFRLPFLGTRLVSVFCCLFSYSVEAEPETRTLPLDRAI